MPSQDANPAPDARRLSRRSLLHGVATAGAAGIAATAISASPAAAATRRATNRQAATGLDSARQDPAYRDHARQDEPRLPDGPITVHVHDARSGDIEVFCGDGRSRLRDRDLAAQIARALRHAS
jgi:hypothetical protein